MSGFALPDVVKELLTGPWNDVLYITLLQEGEDSDSWVAATKTTEDLVESVQPLDSGDDRAAFLEIAPGAVRGLRRGLERYQGDQSRAEELVAALEELHLQMLQEAPESVSAEATAAVLPGGGESDTLDPKVIEQADKLPPDSWVDFRCAKYTGTARLLTRVPVSGKLVFVNRSGVKVGEWGREEFAQALAKAEVVLMAGTRLFDQAMRSLDSK